ncbi:manganese efflux pump [Caldicellulosiruptor owensensis]
MNIYQVLVAILSLNIDALFFGVAFGAKGIKILTKSKLIIFFTSMSITIISFFIGRGFGKFLNSQLSLHLGAIFMIIIGIVFIIRTFTEKNSSPLPETLVNLSLKSLGLTVKIIKEPVLSDIDSSGSIEPVEALLVALALSLDGLSASFSLGLSNLANIEQILLIPVFQFIAISIGNIFAHFFKIFRKSLIANYIPGIVLILLGIYKLF